MKKNVIRLTEAELKQYISKVVKEQTADPAAAAAANKEKVAALTQSLVGQRPQLYLDYGKTKKSHVVSITNIGSSTTNAGVFFFYVKDLAFVTSTGGAMNPQDNMDPIENLRFDCTSPNMLTAMGAGAKGLGAVFCPPMTELVKKAAGCATVDRTPTLASANSKAQATIAEIEITPTLA